MKKIAALLFITCCLSKVFSQSVGINATGATPHASAMLDVRSSTKGILIPRTSTTSRLAISNPAKGLMIYDTTSSSFWFHNGNSWTEAGNKNNTWSIKGNSGINPATNFIGTTDAQPLHFRINNINAGMIDSISRNTGIGFRTLDSTTTAFGNTAIGYKSLGSNADGSSNTAVGFLALRYNKSGSGNTASGSYALFSNISGEVNTATGFSALYTNTTGSYNTAGGYNALYFNTTGNYNTADGQEALVQNQNGSNNTANGAKSLYLNTSGDFNTADGANALGSNTTGSTNSAMGESALFTNNTGYNNTSIGYQSLYSNTSGYANTALGNGALFYNTVGQNNIAIGANSGNNPAAPDVNNSIGIGNDGILNGTNNQIIFGNFSSVGYYAHNSWYTFSDARIKTNIKEEVKGLDFIMRLKAVTYYKSIKAMVSLTGNKETKDFPGKYDVEKIKYSGFLAQEVEQAAKETGYDFSGLHKPNNSRDLYALSYETFVVPLVKGMQEQQVIILNLQKQMELLQKRLSALETKK